MNRAVYKQILSILIKNSVLHASLNAVYWQKIIHFIPNNYAIIYLPIWVRYKMGL